MHLELITLFMFTVADIELIRTLTTRMFKLVGFLLFTKLSTQLKFVTVNICECLNAANLYHSIVSKRYTAVHVPTGAFPVRLATISGMAKIREAGLTTAATATAVGVLHRRRPYPLGLRRRLRPRG